MNARGDSLVTQCSCAHFCCYFVVLAPISLIDTEPFMATNVIFDTTANEIGRYKSFGTTTKKDSMALKPKILNTTNKVPPRAIKYLQTK